MSDAPPAAALPHRGRLWALGTYPLRIGPARPERPTGPFARLAVVHAISSACDAWVTVALAGSVFVSVSLSAARGRTALGLACTVLPFVIVGPFVGPVIDRVRGGRRAIVAASCVGRAVACFFMAHVIHSLWLFPAAFGSLVCSKTYLVARASLVPSAVDRDTELVEANAKLAVGSSVATSIAAVIGAGVYRVFGSGLLLHIDMALLLVGAVLACRLRGSRSERTSSFPLTSSPEPPPPVQGTAIIDQGAAEPLPPSRAEERRARRRRKAAERAIARPMPPGGLPLAAIAMTAMRATAGLMTALVIFAFKRDGAPIIWYGLVGVSSVVGNLGGAALAPAVRERASEERIVPFCALLIGATAVVATQFTALDRRPAALALATAVGICASIAKTAFDAIVQRDSPDMARSKLFARSEAVFQLGWVLAALAPTLISMSLLSGFDVVAVICLASGALFLWGWHRARQGRLPSWWPGAVHHASPIPAGPGTAVVPTAFAETAPLPGEPTPLANTTTILGLPVEPTIVDSTVTDPDPPRP